MEKCRLTVEDKFIEIIAAHAVGSQKNFSISVEAVRCWMSKDTEFPITNIGKRTRTGSVGRIQRGNSYKGG